jgi:hypothetical protein
MSVNRKAYDEVLDFFARGTSSCSLVNYRPSIETQNRVHYLLARNRAGTLTTEEAAEIELCGELEHFIQLVKARARQFV